jgi:FGAM-synthase: phosphoribosylformylglycinamidine synthase
LQATYDKYIAMRDELGRTEKPQTLMDMATIFGRYERAMVVWMTWKCLMKSMPALLKLKWMSMV